MDIQYQIIGERIRQRRRELGYKQYTLAQKLGLSSNHLSSIEHGREHPSLETLLHICELLQITPDYLLLGNMHTNDVSQDILAGLRLCSDADLQLARSFVELLVQRNLEQWQS